jgi:hypothetical protein
VAGSENMGISSADKGCARPAVRYKPVSRRQAKKGIPLAQGRRDAEMPSAYYSASVRRVQHLLQMQAGGDLVRPRETGIQWEP